MIKSINQGDQKNRLFDVWMLVNCSKIRVVPPLDLYDTYRSLDKVVRFGTAQLLAITFTIFNRKYMEEILVILVVERTRQTWTPKIFHRATFLLPTLCFLT